MRQIATLLCQKAPSGQNFARNSLLSTLHQLLEAAEFQRSDFKHRNNRPVITCNIFKEPSVARTKRSIKTVSALNTRGYHCSLSQKEPSAKRCINTATTTGPTHSSAPRQKAPSTKRTIKTQVGCSRRVNNTYCQKLPSAKTCIKTFLIRGVAAYCSLRSESTERQKVH